MMNRLYAVFAAMTLAVAMLMPHAAKAQEPVKAPEAAAAVAHESVDNPYSISAMWRDGDFVTKGTAVILLIMSGGSWYILFSKLFEQFKVMKESNEVSNTFWKAGSVEAGIKGLREGSAFRYIAETGVSATEHHEGRLTDNVDLNTWVGISIQRSVDNVQSRLQDGLAFLGTVGSTAPFIGLFGTVWGIYHALTGIAIAGQASIDKVAGPVGEALIMTAAGLGVAVPAVLGYNWLVRRNKVTMEAVRSFSSDLHAVLLGGRFSGKR